MPNFQFTPEADADIKGIISYTIDNWGKTQANKYVDGLEKLAGNLAKNPTLGGKRDNLIEGLLSFPYISHVIYYTAHENGIVIIRVLHQNMDAQQHL